MSEIEQQIDYTFPGVSPISAPPLTPPRQAPVNYSNAPSRDLPHSPQGLSEQQYQAQGIPFSHDASGTPVPVDTALYQERVWQGFLDVLGRPPSGGELAAFPQGHHVTREFGFTDPEIAEQIHQRYPQESRLPPPLLRDIHTENTLTWGERLAQPPIPDNVGALSANYGSSIWSGGVGLPFAPGHTILPDGRIVNTLGQETSLAKLGADIPANRQLGGMLQQRGRPVYAGGPAYIPRGHGVDLRQRPASGRLADLQQAATTRLLNPRELNELMNLTVKNLSVDRDKGYHIGRLATLAAINAAGAWMGGAAALTGPMNAGVVGATSGAILALPNASDGRWANVALGAGLGGATGALGGYTQGLARGGQISPQTAGLINRTASTAGTVGKQLLTKGEVTNPYRIASNYVVPTALSYAGAPSWLTSLSVPVGGFAYDLYRLLTNPYEGKR